MSSSISDQIAALGLASLPPSQPSPGSPPFVHYKKKLSNSPQAASLAGLLKELPLWGTVNSLEADRGFGHLSCTTKTGPVFFHFTARQPRQPVDGNTLRIGEPILFMVGTDPRKPGGLRAVRWARVRDLPWGGGEAPHDQSSLDAMRRTALAALSLQDLWQLMRADWYARNWEHSGHAPTDLDDRVLETVWRDQLSSTSAQALNQGNVHTHLAQCLYGFAARLSLVLTPNAYEQLLTMFSPEQLCALGPPEVQWMSGAYKTQRQRLMEWYLLSQDGLVERGWEEWFQGRDRDEAGIAEFFIDQGIARHKTTRNWIRRIIDQGWLSSEKIDQWVGDDFAEAVPLFRHLSEDRRRDFLEVWKIDPSGLNALLDDDPSISTEQVVLCGALAVDLETDGKEIWEVGSALAGQASMLYSQKQGTDFATGIAQLSKHIRSALLVVGHNLLAWDWPILARQIEMPQPPLLWDTLLVQYLLEPQAHSHALGGSHHADFDALAAAELFERQFKRLPATFARSLVSGEVKDAAELLDAIAVGVSASISCARPAPDWLKLPGSMNSVLVLPEHRLRDVDWVPGITVVSANPAESLPHHLLQIDAEALGRALDGEASRHPAATVLLAVVRRSVAQGIPIRLGMIPQWLLESSAALEVAVRQACHQPDNPRGLRVAPLPRDVQWLQAAGPAAFRLVGFTGEVLVFDHRHTASPELCQLAKSHFASQLLRIRPSSGGEVWLQADGPARILSKRGRWRSFRTLRIHRELLAPVSAHAEVVRRPVLATRRIHALYPGSIDQANYWTEVIRAFSEVAGHTPEAVPILLVGSSCSRKLVELLGTGLDEIGWGEVRPAHRSRREHLLRAARNHWALVDVLDQWPQWQAIAQLAGVTLLPVVEALPIEQWYAARLAQSSESVEADAESEVEETHLLEALALAQLEDEGDGADESAETDEVNEALEVAAVAVNFIPTTDKPAAVWPVDLGQC